MQSSDACMFVLLEVGDFLEAKLGAGASSA
jgi:hypothetical protein